ncbi:MAG: hypothetical protein WD845_18625 [Pirellulales bacterium]
MSEGPELLAIKRISNHLLHLGGEQHSGWLPPGAAIPPPTPELDVLVDLEIQFDGGGYLVICQAQDGSFCWDHWYESLDDAVTGAVENYGVDAHHWQSVSSDT